MSAESFERVTSSDGKYMVRLNRVMVWGCGVGWFVRLAIGSDGMKGHVGGK